jgi:ATP-dependent Clp protease ATP-binding subunit ClpC
VIVMTSNLGAGAAKRGLGFTGSTDIQPDEQRMQEAAKRAFLPEFLNRIDEIVTFKPLTEEQVEKIAAMIVERVGERLLEERDVALEVSEELVAQLARDGFDGEFGARPLKRHVRRTLEKELTRAILAGDVGEGDIVRASLGEGGAIVLATAPTLAVAA